MTPIGQQDKCPASCNTKAYSYGSSGSVETCTCSHCGENHNACVDAYGDWVCDELGPISALYTGSFGLFIALACAWCFAPCITFGFAQISCINAKRNQGREPKAVAWLACIGTIVLFGLCGAAISFGWTWLIFSFVMVIPFAIDSCYDQPRMPHVNIITHTTTTYAQQPQVLVQQPMMVQQPAGAPQQFPPAFNPHMQEQGQVEVVQATYVPPEMKG